MLHSLRRIHLYTDVKIWSPLKRSNLVVVWRASNVDRHPKLTANKNIRIQISAIWIPIQILVIWIPILCINSPMVSKSIAIAYSYTKQHCKKNEIFFSQIKFYNWRNKKKKKEFKFQPFEYQFYALTHPWYPKALLLPILIQNNTAKK